MPFQVSPAHINEVSNKTDPVEIVEDLSIQKAQAVLKSQEQDSVVIGSDTIVYFNGEILGKPSSREHAKETLQKLSGQEHEVYTGVSLCSNMKTRSFFVKSKVRFRPIPSDLLELYLDSGESMDKAGAYGIQANALAFIERVEGSYSNVVGLPVDSLLIALKSFMEELEPDQEHWRDCFV